MGEWIVDATTKKLFGRRERARMRLLTTAACLELGRGGRLGLARPLAASSFLRVHVRVEVPLALNSPRTLC